MRPNFTEATINGEKRLLLQVGWSCNTGTGKAATQLCAHNDGYCGPTFFILPVGYEWPENQESTTENQRKEMT